MKPLRRSVTFWCGLFVLVFLLWVWVDSLSHVNGIFYRRPVHSERVQAQVQGGTIAVMWDEGPLPKGYRNPPPPFPFSFYRVKEPAAQEWWPDLYGWADVERFIFGGGTVTTSDLLKMVETGAGLPMRRYHVVLPLWAVIAVYAAAWLGLLKCRRRRKG